MPRQTVPCKGFFLGVGVEPGASHVLGTCSPGTTSPDLFLVPESEPKVTQPLSHIPGPFFFILYLEIEPH